MFFVIFRLTGVIDWEHRFICSNAEGFRVGNGVVHIQGTAGHFLLKKLGSELFKALIWGGVGSYKGQTTGEGTEKTDTYE